MNAADLAVSSPLIIMSATAVIGMLAVAIQRNHAAVVTISLVGVGASLWSLRLRPLPFRDNSRAC